eukprot:6483966-Amphidinium_carterae.1
MQQLEHKDDIMKMKQAVVSRATDVPTIFGKAVYEVAFYKLKMETFCKECLSMEVHQPQLEKVKAFWAKTEFLYDEIPASEMIEALEDLTMLASDLSEDYMSAQKTHASSSSHMWWQSGLKALSCSGGSNKGMLSSMEAFLAAAEQAFPLEQ